jgi:hypothetical protein
MRALRQLAAELICLALLVLLVLLVPSLFFAFWGYLLGGAADWLLCVGRRAQAFANRVREGGE